MFMNFMRKIDRKPVWTNFNADLIEKIIDQLVYVCECVCVRDFYFYLNKYPIWEEYQIQD